MNPSIKSFETLESRQLLAVNVLSDLQAQYARANGPSARNFQAIGETVYFSADRLWKTDGTPDGTDIVDEVEDRPSKYHRVGDSLVLQTASGHLWKLGDDSSPIPLDTESTFKSVEQIEGDDLYYLSAIPDGGRERSLKKLDVVSGEITTFIESFLPPRRTPPFLPLGETILTTNWSEDGSEQFIARIDVPNMVTPLPDVTFQSTSDIVRLNDVAYFIGVERTVEQRPNLPSARASSATLYSTDGQVVSALYEFEKSLFIEATFKLQAIDGSLVATVTRDDAEFGSEMLRFDPSDPEPQQVIVNGLECGFHCDVYELENSIAIRTWNRNAQETKLWRHDFQLGRSTFLTDIGSLSVDIRDRILYFKMDEPDGSISYWKSDGTAEGTMAVDAAAFRQGDFAVIEDGVVSGQSGDRLQGFDPWIEKTDGDQLLAELPSDWQTNVEVNDFFLLGDEILIDIGRNPELWVASPDSESPVLLSSLRSDLDRVSIVNRPRVYGIADHVHYVSESEGVSTLWATDGTKEGTVALFSTNDEIQFIEELDQSGSSFQAFYTPSEDRTRTLWVTTDSGVEQLASHASPTGLLRPTRYLEGIFYEVETETGDELRYFDGSSIRTILADEGPSQFGVLPMNDGVLIPTRSGSGRNIFVLNEDLSETEQLANLPGVYIKAVASSDDRIMAISLSTSLKTDIWTFTNETDSITQLPFREQLDFEPHLNSPLVTSNGLFVFHSTDGDLWQTDGTIEGTELLWSNETPLGDDELKMTSQQLNDIAVLRPSWFDGVFFLHDGELTVAEGTFHEDLQTGDNRILAFDDQQVWSFGANGEVEQTQIVGGQSSIWGTEATDFGAVVYAEGEPNSTDVYRTDGTAGGTYILETFPYDMRNIETQGRINPVFGPQPKFTDDSMFFVSPTNETGKSLWEMQLTTTSDVNADGRVDAEDMDDLAAAIRKGENMALDVNGDQVVDAADRRAIVEQTLQTEMGDLDLDGRVNFADFLTLAANFGNSENVGWDDGDVNGDGEINLADFLLLAANFGTNRFA